jgi:meso-butanediol dehydrogenase/(S,S)-butanediol dehydrogenase/diacetyl reductase
VARRLAAEGAAVAVTDLQEEKAAQVASELGDQAIALRLDVTSREDVDTTVATVIDRFGQLDVLVNNAGGCIVTSAPEDTTPQEWHQQLDLTLVGASRCIQAALPHLVKSRGNVVTISSVNGLAAFGNIEYSAAKAGQIAMTVNYAARYGALGVRFNTVAPGTIRTPVWDHQQETLRQFIAMYPLGRVGEPDDVAAAVAFLASDDASWITGHTLPVEGGILTGPGGGVDLTPAGWFKKDYPQL